MIDVYGESVFDGIPGHRVEITDGGTPISASRPRRERGNVSGHDGIKLCQQENGLMATDWTYLDRLSAIIWNRMKGARAHLGNYNEPPDIGWFLNDLLPAENRIRIVDRQGRPVPGAHSTSTRRAPRPSRQAWSTAGTSTPRPTSASTRTRTARPRSAPTRSRSRAR